MSKIYENEKIRLRPMTEEDTSDIICWRNSEAVKKHFIYREPFTEAGHKAWIENMIKTGKTVQMMICEKASGRAVGSVYIRDIDPVHKKGEYGIFIGEEEARGQGIGTEAARLMIRYAFEELRLHKLFLRVFADNPRAIRSYEKAGFEKEAYLRDEVFLDGNYHDMLLMAVLAKAGT